MDEIKVDSIRVRSDLIGDFEKTDKLKGYAAECFLKKLLKSHEQEVLDYLQEKWGFAPYIQYLPNIYVKKYKKYLRDKEARQYIYEKYAEKQSTVDILCGRLTDLDAAECIKLKEKYESEQFLSDRPADYKLIDRILTNYEAELRLLVPNDISKVRNMQ